MKAYLQRTLPDPTFMIFIIFVILASWLFASWIFIRFLHYHSQNKVLPAGSYSIELITAEDYAKLNDPSLETVTLSNGTTISDRQSTWYKVILPNYKPVGDQYALVTTLGTAHYYRRWITDAMPLMMWTAFGLLVTIWELRRQQSAATDGAVTAPTSTVESI